MKHVIILQSHAELKENKISAVKFARLSLANFSLNLARLSLAKQSQYEMPFRAKSGELFAETRPANLVAKFTNPGLAGKLARRIVPVLEPQLTG